MKKLILALVVVSGFSACATVKSAAQPNGTLVYMLELMKVPNDEAIYRDHMYVKARRLSLLIPRGVTVDKDEVEAVRSHCQKFAAEYGTPKLRRKAVNRTMRVVDDELLMLVGDPSDNIVLDAYDARKLSGRIRQRLTSLLEYQAQKYEEACSVIQ